MEYLDAAPLPTAAAPRRRRPWVPYVAGAVTFLIVLVGFGLLAGDYVLRNLEMRDLVSQVEVSEHAMEETQAAVTSAVESFQGTQPLDDTHRTALEDALKAAAATGLEGVKAGGDAVAQVKVLRWHSDIEAAKEAYLAHNKAWQDYLAKAAQDPAEFNVTQEQVNTTFEKSQAPMRAAVPSPDLFDVTSRLDVIYAPPPAVDSGPSQQA
jgi:hypothetical protein